MGRTFDSCQGRFFEMKTTKERSVKIFVRILTGLLIVVCILIAACYIYIRLNGRQWVVNTLTQVFAQPVELKNVHFLFPFGARITDLNITEVLQVKDVQLQMGLPDLWHGRFHLLLLNLSAPVLAIERRIDSQIVLGNFMAQPTVVSEIPTLPFKKNTAKVQGENLQSQSKKSFNMTVDYLLVTKGEIKFRDYSRKRNFAVDFRDVDLRAQNVSIPSLLNSVKFDLTAGLFKDGTSANLPFPLSGSRVKIHGWFNWGKKDMQAQLDVTDPDGKANLNAYLNSKDNHMTIDGKVHVANLLSKEDPQPQDQTSLEGLIFSSLQSSGVEISADFHSKTKMDDVQLDSVSFRGDVGYKDTKNIGEHFEELGKKLYQKNLESGGQPPRNKEAPVSK